MIALIVGIGVALVGIVALAIALRMNEEATLGEALLDVYDGNRGKAFDAITRLAAERRRSTDGLIRRGFGGTNLRRDDDYKDRLQAFNEDVQ